LAFDVESDVTLKGVLAWLENTTLNESTHINNKIHKH
jgi:hypothetical protein